MTAEWEELCQREVNIYGRTTHKDQRSESIYHYRLPAITFTHVIMKFQGNRTLIITSSVLTALTITTHHIDSGGK